MCHCVYTSILLIRIEVIQPISLLSILEENLYKEKKKKKKKKKTNTQIYFEKVSSLQILMMKLFLKKSAVYSIGNAIYILKKYL